MVKRLLVIRVVIVSLVICFLTIIAVIKEWNYLTERYISYSENKDTLVLDKNHPTKQSNLSGLGQTQKADDRFDMGPSREADWKNSYGSSKVISMQNTLSNPNEQTIKQQKSYKRIAFLKVHKAGSTTAQNIFLRYGEHRNLTFLISKQRKYMWDNIIAMQTTLNENNTLPPPPNKTFDILCCHVIYNYDAFQKYMPKDTAYIGIVREPFEQFLSTLNYFGGNHIFNRIQTGNKVVQYLQNPGQYEQELPPHWSMTNNRMSVEFGFPTQLFKQYSKDGSMAYIEKLDREFQLVIVMEYFPESIVLMRRILGWSIKDILYIKKNKAMKHYSFVDYTRRHLYERFAKLDYDLYNHFHKKLWDGILQEGSDFQEELLYFNRLRKEIEDFCIHISSFTEKSYLYKVAASKWNDVFTVSHSDCWLLERLELPYIAKIRKRQYGITSKYLPVN